ncbi:TPA: hypothetical protein G8N62_002186 [Salmonella enterica]|uniref:Uncharacterized protein n=1 Tax=Salmonella enterica TaxID=28901 RepID=A0A744JST1_SALER|nr:hypothetical protein [Salmonella enterica]EBW2365394.1 hypothetical protein [Salmonella enterica subsp. enterica serovar Ajiobo]EDN5728478.1 hypothetical protein [Salmonella enterica subsp. enterica serovar Ajiobo]EEE8133849.1 hypothetical protein [Salmonella enterica subsp. enterica serovar Ajiobo]HAF2593098.1 hypothetical protein [Salmonella enterica]
MNNYPDYVDKEAIDLYESGLLPDFKIPAPDDDKDDLDSTGCVLNSNAWNEQISAQEVMHEMIFDERMSPVWSALKKRAGECPSPFMFYVSLCTEISIIFPGPDDWSLLTPSEKKKKLNKINKLALELCKEIANTPLDNDVMNYTNHKLYFDRFKRHCLSENTKKELDFNLNFLCKLDNNCYVPIRGDLENAVGNVWSNVGVTAPSVSSLLQDIFYKTRDVSYDSVIKRKSQVRRAYFIRKLSMLFQSGFDSPLYVITAAISSVFLDEDITTEEVRSTLR